MLDWDAQRSLQFLMQRGDEFVGAIRRPDDITCLVLRCESQLLSFRT